MRTPEHDDWVLNVFGLDLSGHPNSAAPAGGDDAAKRVQAAADRFHGKIVQLRARPETAESKAAFGQVATPLKGFAAAKDQHNWAAAEKLVPTVENGLQHWEQATQPAPAKGVAAAGRDLLHGAGQAASELDAGAKRAGGDLLGGAWDGVKSFGSGLKQGWNDVADGVSHAAHDVADGAHQGHLLDGVMRARQDVAVGGGQALSDTWHGAADGVGKTASGAFVAAHHLGGSASRAYDRAADGLASGVGDVAGAKAADRVRRGAQALATPVRSAAKFQLGMAQGVAEGAGSMVRGIGDMAVGAVRLATDEDRQAKFAKGAVKFGVGAAKLAWRAQTDPTGLATEMAPKAEALWKVAKTEGGKFINEGKDAAKHGGGEEWGGHAIGRAGFEIASFFVAPEAKVAEGAKIASLVEHATEVAGDVERVTNAAGKGAELVHAAAVPGKGAEGAGWLKSGAAASEGVSSGVAGAGAEDAGKTAAATPAALEAAGESAAKKNVVLVDSGLGGGMTAALLKGKVKQIGSYFCLPLGDKPEAQAAAYTAAMILSPLVPGLAKTVGVADHVIVACNSASVRVKEAFPMIEKFAKQVRNNPGKFAIEDAKKQQLISIADNIDKDPNWLAGHIHDIATPTAKAGGQKAFEALTATGAHEGQAAKDSYFMRVESTNGTVGSQSYPQEVTKHLTEQFGREGYTLDEAGSHAHEPQSIAVGNDAYQISHHTVQFKKGDQVKTVLIENRGNPSWVPQIEKGSLDDVRKGLDGTMKPVGEDLVARSAQASRTAVENLTKGQAGFEGTPDLNLLSCTHYPAMQKFLTGAAAKEGGNAGEFLNQATIVEDMVGKLDPAARVATQETGDALEIEHVVGTRAEGGQQYLKTEGALADPASGAGQAELARKAKIIEDVVQETRRSAGVNEGAVKVTARVHDPAEEAGFEELHNLLGPKKADEIMAEQGYTAKVKAGADGKVALSDVEATAANADNVLKAKTAIAHPDVAKTMDGPVGKRIGQLAQRIVGGEQRGMDVLATQVDVAGQLRQAATQVSSVIKRNAGRGRGEQKEAVGILTGFKVIANDTRKALGGENDGPPGAVVLAKSILDQKTPVSLVTDEGSEESLMESLVGAGLAKLKKSSKSQEGAKTLADYELKKGVSVHVAKVTREPEGVGTKVADRVGADEREAARIKEELARSRTSTMISIERPSPNSEGMMTNMRGQDISEHNADLSSLLEKKGDWQPYTVGIGDGGNEVGMGGLHDKISTLRRPDLEPVVNNGNRIAASAKLKTDALVLSSVSNNGGIALAMATRAAIGKRDVTAPVDAYDKIIQHLYSKRLSIDGVSKRNALTIDGRALGTRARAAKRTSKLGTEDATHHDMFRKMEGDLTPLR